MAFDAFLKIEGVDGDSTARGHENEIEIASWSWGLGNASNLQSGAGAAAGKVSMQDFHFTMKINKASPTLMKACATGQHFREATLTARKAGEKPVEFLKIKLTEILVSSYETDGNTAEDIPMDQMSLNFSKIDFVYTAQGPAGDVTTTSA
jgi:type VI secretion system secreted protein Hcp